MQRKIPSQWGSVRHGLRTRRERHLRVGLWDDRDFERIVPIDDSWADMIGGVKAESYGAIGNGVVDDSAAIARAVNANKGHVILSRRTYNVATLADQTFTAPIRLRGQGIGLTTLSGGNAATMTPADNQLIDISGVTFSGFLQILVTNTTDHPLGIPSFKFTHNSIEDGTEGVKLASKYSYALVAYNRVSNLTRSAGNLDAFLIGTNALQSDIADHLAMKKAVFIGNEFNGIVNNSSPADETHAIRAYGTEFIAAFNTIENVVSTMGTQEDGEAIYSKAIRSVIHGNMLTDACSWESAIVCKGHPRLDPTQWIVDHAVVSNITLGATTLIELRSELNPSIYTFMNVTFSGIVGTTELNGNTYRLVRRTDRVFQLYTTAGVAIDSSTGYGAFVYDTGGIITVDQTPALPPEGFSHVVTGNNIKFTDAHSTSYPLAKGIHAIQPDTIVANNYIEGAPLYAIKSEGNNVLITGNSIKRQRGTVSVFCDLNGENVKITNNIIDSLHQLNTNDTIYAIYCSGLSTHHGLEIRDNTTNFNFNGLPCLTYHNLRVGASYPIDNVVIDGNVDNSHFDAATDGLQNAGLARSGNFQVTNGNAFTAEFRSHEFTLDPATVWDTGTTMVLPALTWGIFILSIDKDGTQYVDEDDNAAAGYATEALALAALVDGDSITGEILLGWVTVRSTASGWTAGTDALENGTGGTPAGVTNYYSAQGVPNPVFGRINNFDIQSSKEIVIHTDGRVIHQASTLTFPTDTMDMVLAADTWGAAVLSIDYDGTLYADPFDNDDAGYATEALAKAAAVTWTGEFRVGVVTIKTGSGTTWTAGTDALQGGVGGNASSDTNYSHPAIKANDFSGLSSIRGVRITNNHYPKGGYEIPSSEPTVLGLTAHGNAKQFLRSWADGDAALVNGATAGYVQAGADFGYVCDGQRIEHDASANTDHWDLRGVSTGAGEFKKVLLMLDVSGNALWSEGLVAPTQQLALWPDRVGSSTVIGWVEIPASYNGGAIGAATIFTVNGEWE